MTEPSPRLLQIQQRASLVVILALIVMLINVAALAVDRVDKAAGLTGIYITAAFALGAAVIIWAEQPTGRQS